jgi:hypothetical protein
VTEALSVLSAALFAAGMQPAAAMQLACSWPATRLLVHCHSPPTIRMMSVYQQSASAVPLMTHWPTRPQARQASAERGRGSHSESLLPQPVATCRLDDHIYPCWRQLLHLGPRAAAGLLPDVRRGPVQDQGRGSRAWCRGAGLRPSALCKATAPCGPTTTVQ